MSRARASRRAGRARRASRWRTLGSVRRPCRPGRPEVRERHPAGVGRRPRRLPGAARRRGGPAACRRGSRPPGTRLPRPHRRRRTRCRRTRRRAPGGTRRDRGRPASRRRARGGAGRARAAVRRRGRWPSGVTGSPGAGRLTSAARLDPGQLLEVPLGGLEGALGAVVVHVADVCRQPGPAPGGQGEGVLQVAADRQHRLGRERQVDRHRRVAPGATDRERVAVDDPHHRVVAGHVDRPVVGEPGVRQLREPAERVGVVGDDRLAGHVPARHHQHAGAGESPGSPSSSWCSGV